MHSRMVRQAACIVATLASCDEEPEEVAEVATANECLVAAGAEGEDVLVVVRAVSDAFDTVMVSSTASSSSFSSFKSRLTRLLARWSIRVRVASQVSQMQT